LVLNPDLYGGSADYASELRIIGISLRRSVDLPITETSRRRDGERIIDIEDKRSDQRMAFHKAGPVKMDQWKNSTRTHDGLRQQFRQSIPDSTGPLARSIFIT
jgi:hypothetical protein